MGRMLEALGKVEAKRGSSAADSRESPGREEEIPYIEVGPAHAFEASPRVLAVRPAPHLRIVPVPTDDLGPIVEEPASFVSPRAVRFQPLSKPCHPAKHKTRFSAELVTFHQPDHSVSQNYRQLAATLLENSPKGISPVILCTALVPGTGTTTVVLNLAISLARLESVRVVVVDGNRQRPALADRLGLRGLPGLAEVLSGEESLDRALQETGLVNLSALTAGACSSPWQFRALGETCRPVFRQLRDRFEAILIDGDPPSESGEIAGLELAADAVYLVGPAAEAPSEVPFSLQELLRRGVTIQGWILTGN
jgi:Mrp family chromosome partitioning ATPase